MVLRSHIESMKQSLALLATLLLHYTVNAQTDFTEVSASAGINHAFQVDLATFGGGAAVLDFDNDGWEDVYITGGVANDVLYRNQGDGTFVDVHAQAGFERTKDLYTQGVSAADINRDGFKDIMVTTFYNLEDTRNISPNLLYLNNGNGTFTDVTKAWGLEAFASNSQGATFGDLNADGFPDLFICNYYSNQLNGSSVLNEEIIANSFTPGQDFLFLNASGKYFVEVSERYGLVHDGFGFQGVFTDYDNDQDADLLIANDFGFRSTPNLFYRNDAPVRTMTDRALNIAMNYGMNAMGITSCDYNSDGYMDYFITNISTSVFVENQVAKNGNFYQASIDVGLALPTISDSIYTGVPISWGTNFFDYDHDGDMDLFVCNGALNPTIRLNPNLFFENENGLFTQVAREKGLFDERIGRGSVIFDYDKDGDMDLLIVNQKPRDPFSNIPDARCLLYRNDAARGNWLQVELKGLRAEKNGIGSRIEIVADGVRNLHEIDGGSSHLSQNSTVAHFGLGDATSADVTIKWLGGKVQPLGNIAANQRITVLESADPVEAENKSDLEVFPGFFYDDLTIEYRFTNPTTYSIDIFDAQGRWIEQLAEANEPSETTGLLQWRSASNIPTGTYFVRLRTEYDVVSRRVVKAN